MPTERVKTTLRFHEQDMWIYDTLQALASQKSGMGFRATINSEVLRILKAHLASRISTRCGVKVLSREAHVNIEVSY